MSKCPGTAYPKFNYRHQAVVTIIDEQRPGNQAAALASTCSYSVSGTMSAPFGQATVPPEKKVLKEP